MTFKELRKASNMNMKQFSEYFNIPYRTVQNWENEVRKCPEYLTELIQYRLEKEGLIQPTEIPEHLLQTEKERWEQVKKTSYK